MKTRRVGKQPPRYTFFLNPYIAARFTKCPKCDRKNRQKKLPLVIHVDNWGMIVLNKTCRYCPACDLLIAHKDEIEAQIARCGETAASGAAGGDYLVIGTVDRSDWRRGTEMETMADEMIQALYEFKNVVQFKLVAGWGRVDQ